LYSYAKGLNLKVSVYSEKEDQKETGKSIIPSKKDFGLSKLSPAPRIVVTTVEDEPCALALPVPQGG